MVRKNLGPLRGTTYWARGRITHQGQPLGDYVRCSTGASNEAGAWAWCREEEARRVRRFLIGDESALTFAEAVLLYESDPKTANYLIRVVQEIGDMTVATITPRMVRELGAILYPTAGTSTWTRQVVSPVRAVINNAHDLGKCGPIRIKGFSKSDKVAQDKKRGSTGRSTYPPGSWEWLLAFRQHAERKVATLALFMFVTGARIGQATAMHPDEHLELQNARVCVPGAKGHHDRWLKIPMELVAELASLPRLWPRGRKRTSANLRVFGYADRTAPRKAWKSTIKAAKIEFIPFHAAGRHGFGQEMNVRRGVDEKAAGSWGGWSDTNLMRRTYTHAEAVEAKMHEAFYEGLREAERKTGLSLAEKQNSR